ncbi:Hsp20/alpha crystallin family protein [Mesorhizobium sp. M1050]|uniref:Hsp20/alpha crystallin family protein n=1 Tax=unclassified Mesorhizobium TaxID=325217 RepID=UPI0003CE5C3F|nr:Hsp20/alpha crystallin family protein [Mesorhizobium sp. LNHC252B00]ESY73763.1 molecular chaperone Hsp20 [Mesorhizobium sp. LNHC252B00]
MNMRDLIPWGRNNNQAPSIYSGGDPFLSLHREVNRLFDDVLRSFETRLPTAGQLSPFDGGWPKVEISESDNELRVTAEVPGMEEKDIEVLLDEDMLTLRGEKRSETEEKGYSERFYGHFERRIPLGYEVEDDKVKASFANGVLTLTLPKNPNAQSKVKRIPITH